MTQHQGTTAEGGAVVAIDADSDRLLDLAAAVVRLAQHDAARGDTAAAQWLADLRTSTPRRWRTPGADAAEHSGARAQHTGAAQDAAEHHSRHY